MDTHGIAPAAGLIPILDGIPGPWGLTAFLLFVTFVLHLLLMNMVVGLSVISFVRKVRQLRPGTVDPAKRTPFTPDLLLPKGVALLVNFGIPPFLFLQCLFGQYIYTSSVLMALWWLSVMLLVMLAYYGLYLNMSRRGLRPGARALVSGLVCLLLVVCAFFFVNNMTLLQAPERWLAYARESGGRFLNIADPQVVPRWLHVLLAALAVGGLALAVPAALKRRAGEGDLETAAREREGLRWFLYATLLQLPVGGWFLLSLPAEQKALFMGGNAAAGALFAAALSLIGLLLWAGFRKRPVWAGLGTLGVIVLMAGMRTHLRASMLAPYYRPDMRETEVGPLLLFGACFALSAIALVGLAALYRRKTIPPHVVAAGMAEETLRAFDAQTKLVIEIEHERYPRAGDGQTDPHGRGGKRP